MLSLDKRMMPSAGTTVMVVVFSLLVACTFLPLAATHKGWGQPLLAATVRPQLLRFGVHVTPEHTPLSDPERFIGYHAGLDYEIFPSERERDVPVFAICPGRIQYEKWVNGYGGVLIEECLLNGNPVTVLYGHLDSTRFSVRGKDTVQTSQPLGVLAPYRSHESDGNRKHLHLEVHRGADIQFLGYVQDPAELKAYIDPANMLQ